MHEIHISEEIIMLVLKEARKFRGKKVKRVIVKIGALCCATPEYIQFYFRKMSQNTIIRGAVIDFVHVPLQIKCKRCGAVETQERFQFMCSRCKDNKVEIISGSDIQVESIEIE